MGREHEGVEWVVPEEARPTAIEPVKSLTVIDGKFRETEGGNQDPDEHIITTQIRLGQ